MFARLRALLLQNRSTRQTIVKNLFWLSTSQIVGRLIRAAIVIYAARVLGAAEYGVFSYVLGIAGFFTIFADLGVSNILTREAARDPERRTEILATTFWIKAVLLAGTAAVMVTLAPSLSHLTAARVLIPLVALLTIFDGFRDFCLSFLRALERMEVEAFVNTFTNLIITAAGFAVLSLSATAGALTLSYVASSGIGTLAVVWVLRREIAQVVVRFRRERVRSILAASVPIAVLGLLGTFMLNTDMIMLGWWRAPEELGYYAAAQKVLQILYLLPAILASAVFPALSRFVGRAAHADVTRLMEQAMRAVLAIALPVAVGGVVLAEPLMVLLYGVEYASAAAAFRFLVVTVVLVFPGTLLGNLAIAYNEQKRLAAPVAAGSIGNIALNALLIPPFGIAGCSIATIGAMLLDNGLMWRIVKRRMSDFRTLRHLPRILLSTAVMGIAAWLFDRAGIPVVLTVLLAGFLYLGVLFALREPLARELRTILRALRSRDVPPEPPLPEP